MRKTVLLINDMWLDPEHQKRTTELKNEETRRKV